MRVIVDPLADLAEVRPVEQLVGLEVVAQQPGLVTEITYRPAPHTVVRQQWARLTADEQQHVTAVLDQTSQLAAPAFQQLTPLQQARTLDMAIELNATITERREINHGLLVIQVTPDFEMPRSAAKPSQISSNAG